MSKGPNTTFNDMLARKYGVEEAILISHFQGWITWNKRMKKNFHDGRTWSYQTRKEMAAHFGYWNRDKVRRLTESLVEKGVLVCDNFNKSQIDQTLWYAFANEEDFIDNELIESNNVYERQNCQMGGKSANPFGNFANSNHSLNHSSYLHVKEPPQTPPEKEVGFFASASEEEDVFVGLIKQTEGCNEEEGRRAYWAAREYQVLGVLKKDIYSWMVAAIRKKYKLGESLVIKHRCLATEAAKKCKRCLFKDGMLYFDGRAFCIPVSRKTFIEDFKKAVHEAQIESLYGIV